MRKTAVYKPSNGQRVWDWIWSPIKERKLYTFLVPLVFYFTITFLPPYIMWVALAVTISNWLSLPYRMFNRYDKGDTLSEDSTLLDLRRSATQNLLEFFGVLFSTLTWVLLFWKNSAIMTTILTGFHAAYLTNFVPVLVFTVSLFIIRELLNTAFVFTTNAKGALSSKVPVSQQPQDSDKILRRAGARQQALANLMIFLALLCDLRNPHYTLSYICISGLLFNESTNIALYASRIGQWAAHAVGNCMQWWRGKDPDSDSDIQEKASTGAENDPYAVNASSPLRFSQATISSKAETLSQEIAFVRSERLRLRTS